MSENKAHKAIDDILGLSAIKGNTQGDKLPPIKEKRQVGRPPADTSDGPMQRKSFLLKMKYDNFFKEYQGRMLLQEGKKVSEASIVMDALDMFINAYRKENN